MGNREQLLAGAKRCLFDKGYARTTARDIASASGVSLAAIGYHYGTKEALLTAAIREAIEEWGEQLARILSTGTGPESTPGERFAAAWRHVVESFADNRPLWAIQFEIVGQVGHDPALREVFGRADRQARLGLAELFGGVDSAVDEGRALAVGAFYQALLVGLAATWLVDPDGTPSGADVLAAIRAVAAGVGPA